MNASASRWLSVFLTCYFVAFYSLCMHSGGLDEYCLQKIQVSRIFVQWSDVNEFDADQSVEHGGVVLIHSLNRF